MATPKFNNLILTAARRLKAPRSLATEDVNPYTSVILQGYANQAIRDLLNEKLVSLPTLQGFARLFPEYVKRSDELTLADGSVAKPVDAMLVLELFKSTGAVYFTPYDPVYAGKIITGYDVMNIPTATDPLFWEEAGLIKVLPVAVGGYSVYARYFEGHEDLVVDGETDLKLHKTWHGDVINRMVTMGLQDAKNGVIGGG